MQSQFNMIVLDKSQFSSAKWFSSAIAQSFTVMMSWSDIRVIALLNLSVIDMIMLYLSDFDNGKIRIKLIVNVWKEQEDVIIDCKTS